MCISAIAMFNLEELLDMSTVQAKMEMENIILAKLLHLPEGMLIARVEPAVIPGTKEHDERLER